MEEQVKVAKESNESRTKRDIGAPGAVGHRFIMTSDGIQAPCHGDEIVICGNSPRAKASAPRDPDSIKARHGDLLVNCN
jgi:hypothetical protein